MIQIDSFDSFFHSIFFCSTSENRGKQKKIFFGFRYRVGMRIIGGSTKILLSFLSTSSHILQPTGALVLKMPRRSARIRALYSSSSSPPPDQQSSNDEDITRSVTKRTRTTQKETNVIADNNNKKKKKTNQKETAVSNSGTLPRDFEFRALQDPSINHVVGIDEAGRGPLAGPVVAAAVIYPKDTPTLPGIVDSKRITKEDDREELYEQLIKVPNIRWAVSIIDARRIDEINILQATLEGMRSAATCLIDPQRLQIRIASKASAKELGSYVICSESLLPKTTTTKKKKNNNIKDVNSSYFSLIDGNKVPKEMPCDSKAVVKGDSKEFIIAAASILAKVTRDRLMHEYDAMYPEFNLCQHKGYPTKAHIASIISNGVSPIHRLTFAPLKNMNLEEKSKE